LTASVFAFPSRAKGPQPWTNDELAELYRVVEILGRAGLAVETDMGLSDEGDPWFVFCRGDSGDVIAHFARIDGQFVAASIAVDETYKGANFRQIVDQMVQSQPLMLPPPSRGTRLLLHPAVILTAFVATALAHSEKALAADILRPVEAKWDHQPPPDDHAAAGKHKASWFESLQQILRSPSGDSKANPDAEAASNNQGLSLASLIAIAMSAMQPVVDKLSFISTALADELPNHDHASGTAASSQHGAVSDLPVIDQTAIRADDAIMLKAQAPDAVPQLKKLLADASADAQKVAADAGHLALQQTAAAQTVPLKAPVADEVPHFVPQSTTIGEFLSEALSPATLALQKPVVAAAMVESSAHGEASTSLAPLVISLKDISPEALQLLNIKIDATEQSGSSKITDGHGDTVSVQAPPAKVVDPVPHDTTIEVTANNGTDVINAIAEFTTSGQHTIGSTPLQPSYELKTALAGYAAADPTHALTVVLFDSTSVTMDVFPFAPGVIFVDEKLVSHTAPLSNPGGNLILDMADGSSLTLVGVTTIAHSSLV
jgi:hypothetical protein